MSLTDKHINFTQVLRIQYPSISGFMLTLLQYKPLTNKLPSGIQIIHCHDSIDDVSVYDFMFNCMAI